MSADSLRSAVRDVVDFPKPGIIFKDITPVLADAGLFRESISLLCETAAGARIADPLEDKDYGGRGYSCFDPEGHVWSFGSYDPWQQ